MSVLPQNHNLGYYEDDEAAARAFDRAAILRGGKLSLNFLASNTTTMPANMDIAAANLSLGPNPGSVYSRGACARPLRRAPSGTYMGLAGDSCARTAAMRTTTHKGGDGKCGTKRNLGAEGTCQPLADNQASTAAASMLIEAAGQLGAGHLKNTVGCSLRIEQLQDTAGGLRDSKSLGTEQQHAAAPSNMHNSTGHHLAAAGPVLPVASQTLGDVQRARTAQGKPDDSEQGLRMPVSKHLETQHTNGGAPSHELPAGLMRQGSAILSRKRSRKAARPMRADEGPNRAASTPRPLASTGSHQVVWHHLSNRQLLKAPSPSH